MRHAVFMRNVNVGRHGVTREVLVTVFEQAGAEGVSSFLATGNVVLTADAAEVAAIATRAAAALCAQTGLCEPLFVRSMPYLLALVAADPFVEAPPDDIHERCVTFLPDGFPGLGSLPLQSARRDVTVFAQVRGEAYSVTRMVGGRSGYASALIERQTGLRVTTRNWNTVIRLLEKQA
jgi:uncharacterized protein (DUF1697 family)